MDTRRIGQTPLEVSALGFGGNALGNLYAELDDGDARDTVLAAWQTGVTYYDTAPMYGHGLSERRMGDVLRHLPRDEFVLSTKVGRLLQPYGRVPPPRPSLRECLPGSCPSCPPSTSPTTPRCAPSRTRSSAWA